MGDIDKKKRYKYNCCICKGTFNEISQHLFDKHSTEIKDTLIKLNSLNTICYPIEIKGYFICLVTKKAWMNRKPAIEHIKKDEYNVANQKSSMYQFIGVENMKNTNTINIELKNDTIEALRAKIQLLEVTIVQLKTENMQLKQPKPEQEPQPGIVPYSRAIKSELPVVDNSNVSFEPVENTIVEPPQPLPQSNISLTTGRPKVSRKDKI
jgi:hypothetical protein